MDERYSTPNVIYPIDTIQCFFSLITFAAVCVSAKSTVVAVVITSAKQVM